MQPIPIDPTAPPIPHVCVVCRQPGHFLCTGCRVYYYCGTEHQTQHWATHKAQCQTVNKVSRASAEDVVMLLIGWMRETFRSRYLDTFAGYVRAAGRSVVCLAVITTAADVHQPGHVERLPQAVPEYLKLLETWPGGPTQVGRMRQIMRDDTHYILVHLVATYPTQSAAEGPQQNWVVHPISI
jgi:hypothetical protein